MTAVLAAKTYRPGFVPMLAGLQNPLDVASLPVLSVDTFTIYDAPDISLRFNMSPSLVYFDEQFIAIWGQGANEGVSGNHVVYSVSPGGGTWSTPQDVTPIPETGWTEGASSLWLRGSDLYAIYRHAEVGDGSEGEHYYGASLALRGNKWNGSGWDAYQVICDNCMLDKEPILLPNGKWHGAGRDRDFNTQMILGDIDIPSFAIHESWDFDTSSDGWSVTNGTMSVGGGILTLNSATTDSFIAGPSGLTIAGSSYPIVRMRVRRTTGTGPLAQLQLYFNTDAGFQTPPVIVSPPADPSEWSIVEWDLSEDTRWTEHTINQIRIDVGTTGDVIEIDWIEIGCHIIGQWNRLIVPSPDGVLLNEPTILPIGSGSVLSYEYRNEETMTPRTLLRSFSFDGGQTISAPKPTNFPDAKSNRSVMRLSDGRYVLSSNASDADGRRKLMLSVSDDGYVYDRVYLLRGEETHPKWGWTEGDPPLGREGYQYPQFLERDGYLWIIYSRNKEDIQVSRVALDAFV